MAYAYEGFHGASIGKHLQRASQGQYWHTPTEGLRGPLSAYAYQKHQRTSTGTRLARVSELQYRRIFVYTFCLINICLSLSDDANKIKTLNIERA